MHYIRTQKHSASLLQTFIVIFAILGSIYTVVFLGFRLIEKKQTIENYKKESFKHLDYLTVVIHSHFDIIVSDLIFLTQIQEIKEWVKEETPKSITAIQNEFQTFSDARQVYDQIRLLNSDGREIARINRQDKATVISNGKLQNKKSRYYFNEIKKMGPAEIYMSPFDLNIEHNSIETPIKPMIRFGLSIYDDNNKFRGAVILNYLGNIILDDIRNSSYHEIGDIALLNEEGYWLYSKNADLNWAFMYSDRTNTTMASCSPKEWAVISGSPKVQEVINDKLITSTSISPLSDKHFNLHLKRWILEYYILFEDMGFSVHQGARRYLSRSLIIMPILLLFSLIFAIISTQRTRYKKSLEHTAMYDSLTNLPNRNLLFERINRTIKMAKRYSFSFGILFIDLDEFKKINDTYGHKAGDELLKQVGQRLIQCVRTSDTVSRYGGDEFIILLSKINEKGDGEKIADKILKSLSNTFILSSEEIKIGASIGLTIGDETFENSIDRIITKADNAMYAAKANGKNQYVFQ